MTNNLTIQFDPNTIGNVLKLKDLVGSKTNSPASSIKLIHKGKTNIYLGKILKDDQNVNTLGIG